MTFLGMEVHDGPTSISPHPHPGLYIEGCKGHSNVGPDDMRFQTNHWEQGHRQLLVCHTLQFCVLAKFQRWSMTMNGG